MTRERKFELYRIVGKLNNHPANVDTDHLTFCGFFQTEEEFQAHIEFLEKSIKEWGGA